MAGVETSPRWQADDNHLEKVAVRIRARAVRRCGELLKQFDAQGEEPAH